MASSTVLVSLLLVAAAIAAPQLPYQNAYNQPQLNSAYNQPQLNSAYVQPQVKNAYFQPQVNSAYYQHQVKGAYIQPQLVRQGNYLQPQLVGDNYYHPAPAAQPIHTYNPHVNPAARTVAILRQAQDVSLDGTYNYGFESEDGTAVQASAGPLTAVGPEESVQTVTGTFSYRAPDGTPIVTRWIADENGFRAEGDHLPKGPLSR